MAQSSVLRAVGLHSFFNALSSLPPGSLIQANNVVVDRNNVVEPRRGFAKYGDNMPDGADRAKQLISYKGRVIRHFSDVLQFDSNGSGTFQSFDGSYSEVTSGLRIKSIESNGNLYFTTGEGIKKISALSASSFTTDVGFIRDAGAPKALDVTASVDYSQSGFFTETSKVAYRVLWGYKDANENLILGAPSSRTEVTNLSTTDSGVVELSFRIPDQITTTSTEYFYQVYRTAVVQGTLSTINDISAGEEMNLVIEDFPTSSELTSTRVVTVTDITPEDFREGGTLLYTNPVSGDGINQSNEIPPLAKDITQYRGTTFYANTQTKHRLFLDILSVSQLVSSTSSIRITDGNTFNTYTFVGENEITDVTTVADVAGSLNNTYFFINSSSDERMYYVWFNVNAAGTDPAVSGRIGIEVAIATGETADNVATAIETAINDVTLPSSQDFFASTVTNVVTIENLNNGNTTDATAETSGFTIAVTQQGDGENAASNEVLLSGAATPSQQVDETARSLVNIINSNSNEIVYAFYLSTSDGVPGQILLEAKDLGTSTFYVGANSTTTGGQFSPSLPAYHAITAISMANPTIITSTSHGLITGDEIVIVNSNSTPSVDGVHTITFVSANTFSIPVNVTVAGTIGSFFLTSVASDNEVKANRLYFSKFQQPEAVPIVNFIDIGPQDREISRILALRESLFVLKTDAVYRVTGENGSFNVDLFDNSTNIVAPDSAAILNNQIYMLTQQDIATISDTGVSVISRPIENLITAVTRSGFSYSTAAWGISYESDRAYLVFLPSKMSDTVATQCLRYNSFTNAWTKFTITKTCGVINTSDNRMYLGVNDENFIERERKDNLRTDHADREFDSSIPANSVDGDEIQLASTSDVEVGDAIVQIQYLSIYQFNQLLKKLDVDPGVDDNDYFSSLGVSAGDDLRTAVDNLAIKLDADAGVADTDYASSLGGGIDFVDVQEDFNIIIDKLNLDTDVFFSNYRNSENTTEVESIVLSINRNTNVVTIQYSPPFIEGPIKIYRGISASVIWAPESFQDPTVMKQIREGTILFERNNFSLGEVAYSSDLSPDFEPIDFTGVGKGDWGLSVWDQHNWGGLGSQVPLRTYIPRDKQRCRFINCRFETDTAREKWAIFGISFTGRGISEKAYRTSAGNQE